MPRQRSRGVAAHGALGRRPRRPSNDPSGRASAAGDRAAPWRVNLPDERRRRPRAGATARRCRPGSPAPRSARTSAAPAPPTAALVSASCRTPDRVARPAAIASRAVEREADPGVARDRADLEQVERVAPLGGGRRREGRRVGAGPAHLEPRARRLGPASVRRRRAPAARPRDRAACRGPRLTAPPGRRCRIAPCLRCRA